MEFYIFLIAFIVSCIGVMIPGMTSSLGISSMILIGVPIQMAKTTFQVGSIGASVGGLLVLRKTQKVRKELLIPLFFITIVSGYIGGNILINIPTLILMKLTGALMITVLLINIYTKSLGTVEMIPSKKRKMTGFILDFFLNIFYSIFPMGAGVLFQFLYIFFFGMTHLEGRYLTTILSTPFIIAFSIAIVQSGFYHISYIGAYLIGGYIGGYFGAHSGIQLGNIWFRRLLIIWLMILGIYFLFFAQA